MLDAPLIGATKFSLISSCRELVVPMIAEVVAFVLAILSISDGILCVCFSGCYSKLILKVCLSD